MAKSYWRSIQPRKAWRAMRALLADPDDTKQVFHIIEALSGNTGERMYDRFRNTDAGRRILTGVGLSRVPTRASGRPGPRRR